MAGSKTIATILTLQDKMSGKLVTVSKNINNMSKDAQKASRQVASMANDFKAKTEEMASRATKLGTIMATALTAGAIKTGFSEAFDMEGYRVQLETATKDTKKASELMSNAVKFANKTPFETGEVVQATAKMEMYGLSSKRWLSDVADMAGSTNKSIDQATEAMADVAVGEFERIKEFGLKKDMILAESNKKYGEGVVFNAKGQVIDQAKLMDVVQELMQEKFKGGAEKLAGTTKGLWSTITGITKSSLAKIIGMQEDGTIKAGSILEKVKEKVKQVGDKFQEMQDNGTFERIGETAGKVFDTIYNSLVKVSDFLSNNKETIGFILSLAAGFIIALKAVTIFSGVLKGFQIVWALLNGTIALSPVGWVIIGITLLAGAFYLLWTKSETFRQMVGQLWEKIKELGSNLMNWFNTDIAPILSNIGDSLLRLWNDVISPFLAWLAPIFMTVFGQVWNYVSYYFGLIGELIKAGLEIFNGLIDFITGVFSGNWELAWKGIKEIFTGIWDGIKAYAGEKIQWMINKINWVIEKANSVHINIPKIPDVVDNTTNATGATSSWADDSEDIPALASGTPYSPSGLALINEKGGELRRLSSGETIIPADKSKQLIDKANLGGHVFNINFNGCIGEEEFFNKASNNLIEQLKVTLANV